MARIVKEGNSVLNGCNVFKTGVDYFDSTVGGLILSQLVVLAGEAGEGKSTFLLELINSIISWIQIVSANPS